MTAASDSDFAVYVHWPFCLSKCPYCDFNSHVRNGIDQPRWRKALLLELDSLAQLVPHRGVGSVFFGGGTPSLMAPETAAAIIDRIAVRFGLRSDAEITLEANPTSVEATTFADFRAAGVNRLSLGVQALNDADLAFLGRKHDKAEAREALERAIATLERVSFDLIYARPGQSLAAWRSELSEALDFATEHLSLYQLTLEPGTAFFKSGVALPDQDQAAELFELTQEMTSAAGLPAYEISNHARPGAECRHNLVYWRGGYYAGIGPGAHGRVLIGGRRQATETRRTPEAWLQAVETDGHAMLAPESCSPKMQGEELLLMGLRLSEGIDLECAESLLGRKLEIAPLVADGFLRLQSGRLAATARGRLVLNAVIGALA